MDKEQIRNEMTKLQIEMQMNIRNIEVYEKLKEEYGNLKKELAKILFKESMQLKEEIKKSGKSK